MRELSLYNSRLDGRYDIKKLLGKGSYAEIYLAEDTLAGQESPHRFVVIKALNVFMHSDLDRDLERTLVENFQNEALALDRVRHPNVISRLGHGTAHDLNGVLFHFLVLEYLPGGDLAKFARRHSLSLGSALGYLEQVCAGLSHAHGKSVIHRDIKPQNLLLTADHSVVKIADFGVARMSESDAPITRVGTNLYAPPEHSPLYSGTTGRLGPVELTPAADVYSLAKTAYVLITGESPRFFSNGPVTAIPQSVRDRPWAEKLLSILRKATSDDPSARQQNALEFWDELSCLRQFAIEGDRRREPIAISEHAAPKPAYTKGYNPTAPLRPKFDTARELKLEKIHVGKKPGTGISIMEGPLPPPASPKPAPYVPDAAATAHTEDAEPETALNEKTRGAAFRRVRRLAFTMVLIAVFAAGLYATYNYVLSRVSLPAFSSLFGSREATALMNINLRSDPSTANPRIGLVSKGSRLKIISNDGHWYQVVVVEYGTPKTNPDFADRGWISGKTRTGVETIAIEGN